MVEVKGIEPLTLPCKGSVFPLALNPQNGRSSRIRTYDLSLPKRTHSQTVLYSVNWCPWRDSNPHTLVLEPKSSVSTNFTTWAIKIWCRRKDSNPRPPDYKSDALPTELLRRYLLTLQTGQKSSCPNSFLHSLHVFM